LCHMTIITRKWLPNMEKFSGTSSFFPFGKVLAQDHKYSASIKEIC